MARNARTPRRPPPRVALTGGIASGKSTVAGLFAALGVPVIDTDQIARDVVARFGPQMLDAEGRLDRSRLRARAFADEAARRDLERLLHPLIREGVAERSRTAGGDYQLIVVPLLVETASTGDYDRVLVVDCDPTLQRTRLQLRDGTSPAQAEAILAAQATREQRLAAADDVIENTGDLPSLAHRVEVLHARYLRDLTRIAG